MAKFSLRLQGVHYPPKDAWTELDKLSLPNLTKIFEIHLVPDQDMCNDSGNAKILDFLGQVQKFLQKASKTVNF